MDNIKWNLRKSYVAEWIIRAQDNRKCWFLVYMVMKYIVLKNFVNVFTFR